MEKFSGEVLFQGADGEPVSHVIPISRTVINFKPYRSAEPPKDTSSRTDYCELDLTKFVLPCFASIFDFPKGIRTRRVYMESVLHERPSPPMPPVQLRTNNGDKIDSVAKTLGSRVSEPSCSKKRGRIVDDDSDVDYDDEKEKKKMKEESVSVCRPNKKNKKNGGGGGRGKKVTVIDGPFPAPEMPPQLREKIEKEMHGSGIQLILQKQLYKSDVESQQNRFSMPVNQIASLEFLEVEEMNATQKRDDSNRIVGLEVTLIEPDLITETRVDFKLWELVSSKSYMFTKRWSKVVDNSKLKNGDIVQVWFFRDGARNPCFAMVKL